MSSRNIKPEPRFLGEEGQRHFTVTFRSAGAPRGHIVYIPPFGEEMNRCRAHVAQQARDFAASGYYCTLLDFYGTGDSEGELKEASLACWRNNISLTLQTLTAEAPAPVTLWGTRLGAIVAADYIDSGDIEVTELLLWQPVTSGKRYVTQLLRQRVASLVNSGQPAETTAEIRAKIAAGEDVEISGYIVGEALLSDIENASFGAQAVRCPSIRWLENIEQEGDALSTASNKAVTGLREAGSDVDVHLFTGPPIWQLHKRDHASALLALTSSLYAK